MRPLTDSIPKPLLRAGRQRLIEYHLNALRVAGIEDIVINHAHLGSKIVATLGNGSKYGLRISYAEEPDGALETGGGIVNALPQLHSDPFVVLNGDIWTDYDFSAVAEDIVGLAHLVLVDNPDHNKAGDFMLENSGLVSMQAIRPRAALTFSGIGIYSHALFEHAEPGRFPLAPLLRQAAAKNKVSGEHYRGRWFDVGTPQRLAELDHWLSREANEGRRL